jgi:hypothetical protein
MPMINPSNKKQRISRKIYLKPRTKMRKKFVNKGKVMNMSLESNGNNTKQMF